MTERELAEHSVTRMLRDVLIDLSLVSHVRGAAYDASPGRTKPSGGNRPPGGPDWKGDREDNFRQKTHLHFSRRFRRLQSSLRQMDDEAVARALHEILEDARQALQDWRKAPRNEHPRPEDLSEYDKAQIASDVRSARTVAAEWGVSHVTVLRYRKRYSNPVRQRRESDLKAVALDGLPPEL